MLVEILAPDTEAMLTAADELAAADSRLVVASAPPTASRLADVLIEIRARVTGWPIGADRLPHDADAVAVELAWLRALGIRWVLLTQGGWLRASHVGPLSRLLASAAIDVFVVTDADELPAGDPRLVDDRVAAWSWAAFAAEAAGGFGTTANGGGRSDRRVPLPIVALKAARDIEVAAPLKEALALATYARMQRAAARSTAPKALARHLRQELRGLSLTDRNLAIRGAAAAFEEIGVRIRQSSSAQGDIAWTDLWRYRDPMVASAMALHALGATPRQAAAVTISDLAVDASSVVIGRRRGAVPPAGRIPLLAMRHLRRLSGADHTAALLSPGVRAQSLDEVIETLVDGARDLGLTLDPRELDADFSPSRRCLLEGGIAFRRIRTSRPEPYIAAGPRDLRCRHGLGPIVATADLDVSHSQLVCRAGSIADTRNASTAYSFDLAETANGAERWTIKRGEQWSGVIWSVPTPLGRVYVQSQSGRIPSIVTVIEAVLSQQRVRTEASAVG